MDTLIEEIEDIKKRLYSIENILLSFTDIIDYVQSAISADTPLKVDIIEQQEVDPDDFPDRTTEAI